MNGAEKGILILSKEKKGICVCALFCFGLLEERRLFINSFMIMGKARERERK